MQFTTGTVKIKIPVTSRRPSTPLPQPPRSPVPADHIDRNSGHASNSQPAAAEPHPQRQASPDPQPHDDPRHDEHPHPQLENEGPQHQEPDQPRHPKRVLPDFVLPKTPIGKAQPAKTAQEPRKRKEPEKLAQQQKKESLRRVKRVKLVRNNGERKSIATSTPTPGDHGSADESSSSAASPFSSAAAEAPSSSERQPDKERQRKASIRQPSQARLRRKEAADGSDGNPPSQPQLSRFELMPGDVELVSGVARTRFESFFRITSFFVFQSWTCLEKSHHTNCRTNK